MIIEETQSAGVGFIQGSNIKKFESRITSDAQFCPNFTGKPL